jgi:dolichyl-phosphate-mannose--protein O-mannosyl transferase
MNKECERGNPIECSQTIRLRHVQTKHYLHSHDDHRSPLSRFQEISAFQGSDDGDHWVVECLLDKDNNDNDKAKDKGMGGYWRREAPIKLRHKNTGLFMGARKEHVFQHPISGQLEVAGYHGGNKHVSDEFLIWAAQEGVYFAETLKK